MNNESNKAGTECKQKTKKRSNCVETMNKGRDKNGKRTVEGTVGTVGTVKRTLEKLQRTLEKLKMTG